jgi:predicted DNA-binding protein (MmcQ/YjbR family)
MDLLDNEEGRRLLGVLRGMMLRLPEVEEVVDGFGHTTFKVRKKSFVIAGMGSDGSNVAMKSDPETQAYLIRQGRWFRTPYIGQHGWVSITNPGEADREELAELITDAYRLAAPKTAEARGRVAE